MAFNLLGGGAITFIIIAAFLTVVVMLYRSFFGNKPLGDLLGGASKSIGGMLKGISNIRKKTPKQRNSERAYTESQRGVLKTVDTIGSQLDTVQSEHDFNPSRVKAIKPEIATIFEATHDQLVKSKLTLGEISSEGKNLKIDEAKKLIALQNSIESKVAFLQNRLQQHNLKFPEVQIITQLSEKIKKSSETLQDLEWKETQVITRILNILTARIKVIESLHTLIDATEKLLDQEPPLDHVQQIKDNIAKIKQTENILNQPGYSIDELLVAKDEIAQQLEAELVQVQQRSQAQEEIKGRAISFIQSRIRAGAASKKDLP